MLYVVATPIGNLKDISLRALEVLKEVDLILCEDTRVTKKLLEHYNIKTPVLSYHQHSKLNKVNYILDLLKQDKDLALVSDSGTPSISDPGNRLIREIKRGAKLPRLSAGSLAPRFLGNKRGEELSFLEVSSVPGASALIAAASISGFPMDKFIFMGFPPVKKKRKKFFQEVTASKHPVIFYESPYRILKTLKELELSSPNLEVVVCRELTKKFETIYQGKIGNVAKKIKPRGEFVVIVGK